MKLKLTLPETIAAMNAARIDGYLDFSLDNKPRPLRKKIKEIKDNYEIALTMLARASRLLDDWESEQ